MSLYSAIETIYLSLSPKTKAQIQEGMQTAFTECLSDAEVEWGYEEVPKEMRSAEEQFSGEGHQLDQ